MGGGATLLTPPPVTTGAEGERSHANDCAAPRPARNSNLISQLFARLDVDNSGSIDSSDFVKDIDQAGSAGRSVDARWTRAERNFNMLVQQFDENKCGPVHR